MKLRITAVCNVGSVRANNEDTVLVGEKVFRDERVRGAIELDTRASPFAVAVADGMGGANAGEVASQIVLEELRLGLSEIPVNLDDNGLYVAINDLCLRIHQRVLQEGCADAAKSGMGSTLVGLLVYQGRLLFISAGDSRLYRFRDATLMRISRDHSLRELSAIHGDSEANQVPSNIILNSFGGASSFYVDVGVAAKKLQDEDVFLLCSDGVTDVLTDEEIESILDTEGREEAVLAAAIDRGSDDNISYVLVELSEVAPASPLPGESVARDDGADGGL
ncbi:MAG: PP2C family protein-serine/threonine phosphatase [Panacagrimonas sp.]